MFDFKFFRGKQSIFWVTAKGKAIPIEKLSDNHLRNIVNCFLGQGDSIIPDPYLGKSWFEWCDIFDAEIERRLAE